MNKIRYKNLLSVAISTVIASMFSNNALSQNSGENLEEEIIVTGFRGSLLKARDLKREALGAQDSIVAEDIADFPDLNLADSLQRVPGIAITREGGEGRQISLRGLGPDFTRVQLNGMEVLTNSSSPMDSRGSVGRNRAFDFNIFASELFNQIDVKKSFSADQDEGGIGGTVNLRTAKPFDYDGFKSALSANLGTNTNSDSTDPRMAFIISNKWDTYGGLFSIAYSERETSEAGFDTFRWRQRTRTNFDDDGNPVAEGDRQYNEALPQNIKDALETNQIWFARGNRYSDWTNKQERLGITTALQLVPSENISFDFDILYSKLSNSRTEYHLDTSGSSSTALGFVEDLTVVDNNGDLEAVRGTFTDVTLRTETRKDEADTTFLQYAVGSEWLVNEQLTINGLLGYEKSEFEQPQSDKVYFQTRGGITTDYTQDRFYGVNTYTFDPADIANWSVRELDFREDYITTEFTNLKLDFKYSLNYTNELHWGLNIKNFENTGFSPRANDLVKDVGTPTFGPRTRDDDNNIVNASPTDIPANGYSIYSHPRQSWVAADVDTVQEHYGVLNWNLLDPAVQEFYDMNDRPQEFDNSPGSRYGIEEDTLALYLRYINTIDIGEGALRWSLGLRYYSTEITSGGITIEDATNFTVERDYSGVLPTFTVAWDFTEELVWRFSANKNLTRPPLNVMAVSAPRVENDPSAAAGLRVRSGNPDLEPFESINIDTSIEYYLGEVGLFSFAIFYKDIDNFIVPQTTSLPYGELNLPLNLLGEGQDENTIYQFATDVNGDTATIKGVEISLQRDLDFLPEPLSSLGVITNVTLADGTALYRDVQGSGEDQEKTFPGLSETSYNFTLYYETDIWGARISLANRGEYISTVEAGLGDEDERGFHATTYVDFSSFYQVTDTMKISFEGINLTDEREEQYSDSNDRPYNTTTSGRTYLVGFTVEF